MRTQVFCSVGLLRATIAPPRTLPSKSKEGRKPKQIQGFWPFFRPSRSNLAYCNQHKKHREDYKIAEKQLVASYYGVRINAEKC